MRNYPETLMDPCKCAVLIVDHQPQMYFGIQGDERGSILNNTIALAKAAQAFEVPCILTTVTAASFSGQLAEQIQNIYPTVVPIDRSYINCWEDANLRKAVEATGKKHIILAGLWTEACVTFPALTMKHDGYKVYVAADACGGASNAAHRYAMQRMTQAGVVPVTWQQVMLEWQRDWNNKDTYNDVMCIVKQHSGAYGLGVEYSEQVHAATAPKTPEQMRQATMQQQKAAQQASREQQMNNQQMKVPA
ncbi:MAG: hydrolase [Oscillospiraceae bacterium]|jgi:nicotinamidase-related amidase|nr:hydrolase [Oscillospiraceae bacterium]